MSSIAVTASATGTGSVTLLAPNTNSMQTLTLPDATGTVLSTATPGVPINGPAFSAYQSSAQTVSSSVLTKIQFQTKEFDTNNCYDSVTNYRFTPTVAGYYQITWRVGSASVNTEVYSVLYKNGVTFKYALDISGATIFGSGATSLAYANGSTDYFEIYWSQNTGAVRNITANSTETYFQAAMVRSAI